MRAGFRLLVAVAAWMAVASASYAQRPTPERIRDWLTQLDAEDYAAREEATRQLTAAGETGIDALAEGVNSASPEVAWRASESLQQIAIDGNEATLKRVVAALEAQIPVVIATRVAAGAPHLGKGYRGSFATLTAKGAIGAGYLSGLKARILLMVALGQTRDRTVLAEIFARAGGVRES